MNEMGGHPPAPNGGGGAEKATASCVFASGDMASIRNVARSRLIDGMIRVVNGKKPKLFVVLICDPVTLKLVSKTLTANDLVENRVAVVDKLEKAREPLGQMDAIYFVEPTQKNIAKIFEDFPDPTKFKPKYRKAHIYLNDTCTPEAMAVLSSRADVVGRIDLPGAQFVGGAFGGKNRRSIAWPSPEGSSGRRNIWNSRV